MRGCGCLLALVTAVAGIFFFPLWILTLGGIVMFAMALAPQRRPARSLIQRIAILVVVLLVLLALLWARETGFIWK